MTAENKNTQLNELLVVDTLQFKTEKYADLKLIFVKKRDKGRNQKKGEASSP